MTAMVLLIIAGAQAYSQILAASGSAQGMLQFILSLPLSPTMVLITLLAFAAFLGCFIGLTPIILITAPIYLPIIQVMGWDPIWFGLMMLVVLEMSTTTPPFGFLLFVMQGVAPPGVRMGDIVRAGVPFLLCDAIVIGAVLAFPQLALWLPGRL